MGLFGDLWNGAKEVVSKVREVAVSAWNAGKAAIERMRDPKSSETVTEAPVYKPDAGTRYTQSIDDRIHDFLQENLPEADEIEVRLLEACQSRFSEHVTKIKEYVSKRGLSVDVSELDRASQSLEKKFKGVLGRHIKSHFSLSDKGCLEAFSESDSSRRSRSILRHWNSVVNDGLTLLGQNVTKYFNDQNELIQDSIRSRAEQQREIVTMELAQLTQLLELSTAGQAVKEKAKTRVQFVVDCCDVLLNQVTD